MLHIIGRRSGRQYDIPVGYHRSHGRLWVFTDSPWRVNLRRGADIEVTLHAVRTPMRAELEERPEHVAKVYAERIEELGWQTAQRRLGIRIHVGRTPTHEELVEMVRSTGMSIISLSDP
jgi:predicted amino acid racemase